MRLIRLIILAILIFVLVNIISLMKAYAEVRIKDIAHVNQTGETDVMGYGLVIGLNGTGDGKGAEFTLQSVTNMLQRMGITVPIEKVKVKNVAAVLVTLKVPANAKLGDKYDVTVSSIGDASTLEGGTLVMTPLSDRQGTIYGYAQGSVSIGGFNVQVGSNKIVSNYTLVGRVPNGATVEREPTQPEVAPGVVKMSLYSPDYTTVQRIKESINDHFPGCASTVDDAGLALKIPGALTATDDRVQFISQIENLMVSPDAKARVVINEKTGTIVAGEHVSIAPVALAHGNITIEIKSYPVISQPAPFSQGVTKETTDTYISVTEEPVRVVYLDERTNVSEIAAALNAIGATPRDIIAIFQAIKQAGALRAELVVL